MKRINLNKKSIKPKENTSGFNWSIQYVTTWYGKKESGKEIERTT